MIGFAEQKPQNIQMYNDHGQSCIIRRMIGFAEQKPQNIQMYNDHGQSLLPTQEFQRIEYFFGQLFQDSTIQFLHTNPLTRLPFTTEEILQGLRKLPAMKALAPPCMPALI